MNSLKHRFNLGVLFGGILLAASMTPAQAVLAASSDTPSISTSTTAPAQDSKITPANNNNQPATSATETPTQHTDTSQGPNTNLGTHTGNPTNGSSDPSTSSDTTGSTNTHTNNPQSSTNNTLGQSNMPDTNTFSTSSSPTNTPTNNPTNTTQNNTTQTVGTDTQSNAQSGNVSAKGNASVGNVTSGNANNTITQITSLKSSSSLGTPDGLQTFTYDINGNHVGDIVLSPAEFLQTSAATATQDPANASVTNQTNGTITNTINASATSGDVTVAGNQNAGDATSGDAATEANIINMIDSVVSDKQAFLGTININGNLKGNLLLPRSAIDSLLANSPQGTTTANGDSSSTTVNTMNVTNNVTLNAQSGGVTVTGSSSAGNITSGNATTDLKLYNLTDSQIVGGNVLLIFVNVMGSWVGLLMNAPGGTTSAALGGGISEDAATPGGTSNTTTGTTDTINNIINLKSKSGDVAVKGNQSAGNATSGKAGANADIVNIMGSQVDLTGWLGVLIINVYGSWDGSLELQPAAVTLHVHATAPHPAHHVVTNVNATTSDSNSSYDAAAEVMTRNPSPASSHVLGAATTKGADSGTKHTATLVSDKPHGRNLLTDFLIASTGALIIGALAVARAFSTRRKKLTV